MHYILSIYFNSKLVHVSSRLAARHQGDQLCINSSWCSRALCKLIENSVSCWFVYGHVTVRGQQNIK